MPQGFTGVYRVTYAEGRSRQRGTLAIAFASPDRLRLDLMDALGSSRAVLVLTGAGGVLLDPRRRAFRSYETGREALEALAGLPLDSGLLPALLLAEIPRWPGVECRCPVDSPGSDELECRTEGGDSMVRLRPSAREGEIRLRSGAVMTLRYDWETEADAGAPRRLRLEGPRPGVRLDFELREIHFDRPGADLFSMDPPNGFRPLPPTAEGTPFLSRPAP